MRLVETIETMIDLSEAAVADVRNALGPPGRQYAFNIPTAADLLGLYAVMFSEPQQRLDELVRDLEDGRARITAPRGSRPQS